DSENDLEAGWMERLDHVPELVNRTKRIAAGTVGLMRREEGNRRVPPIVNAASRTVLHVKLEHRQQLHRRDAQPLEIRNLFDQTREGAACPFADSRARMAREAAHVQLVDDSQRRGPLQWNIA